MINSTVAFSFEAIILFLITIAISFGSLYAIRPFIRYIYTPYIKPHEEIYARLFSYLCVALIIVVIILTPNFLTSYTGLPYTGLGGVSSKSLIAILVLVSVTVFYNEHNFTRLLYLLPLYYGLHEGIYLSLINFNGYSIPFISPFAGNINYQPSVIIENFWQPISIALVIVYRKALIPKKDNAFKISWLILIAFLAACVLDPILNYQFLSWTPPTSSQWVGQLLGFLWTCLFTITFFFTFCRTEPTETIVTVGVKSA